MKEKLVRYWRYHVYTHLGELVPDVIAVSTEDAKAQVTKVFADMEADDYAESAVKLAWSHNEATH